MPTDHTHFAFHLLQGRCVRDSNRMLTLSSQQYENEHDVAVVSEPKPTHGEYACFKHCGNPGNSNGNPDATTTRVLQLRNHLSCKPLHEALSFLLWLSTRHVVFFWLTANLGTPTILHAWHTTVRNLTNDLDDISARFETQLRMGSPIAQRRRRGGRSVVSHCALFFSFFNILIFTLFIFSCLHFSIFPIFPFFHFFTLNFTKKKNSFFSFLHLFFAFFSKKISFFQFSIFSFFNLLIFTLFIFSFSPFFHFSNFSFFHMCHFSCFSFFHSFHFFVF